MASVTARKRGSTWEYRFEGAKVNGKRQQISQSGFKTKKEAEEAGNKALAEYNQAGTLIIPSEISVSDFLDEWVDNCCKNQLGRNTVMNYEKKIRLYIKPSLGKYKLKALSHSVLQKFINDKFNEGLSRNTLSVIKGILTKSMTYAVLTMKYIPISPMLNVKLPSTNVIPENPSRSKPHVFIPQDKMAAIFERFPEGTSTHLPLMFGYKCGLRIGEAYALTWEDIDFDNKTLTVNRQVQWHEKDNEAEKGYWYFSLPKYHSIRTIKLDDELLSLLKKVKDKSERAKEFYAEEYIHNYESEHTRMINNNGNGKEINLIVVRENGEFIQPRTMQHTSYIIHEKLNYPEFDFHSLRHTHCSMLLEAGAAPKYVQQRLGHKNIKVTMEVYYHLTDKMSQNGDDILNKIY